MVPAYPTFQAAPISSTPSPSSYNPGDPSTKPVQPIRTHSPLMENLVSQNLEANADTLDSESEMFDGSTNYYDFLTLEAVFTQSCYGLQPLLFLVFSPIFLFLVARIPKNR